MKSMKRIAACLLTAALVCSMGTTAFAADASTPETQDMTVTAKATTTTEPTYTITIPATVDLGTITKTAESSVKTQHFEVTASNMNSFPDNKQINISISSDFLLKSGENTLAFRLYNVDPLSGANPLATGAVFTSFTAEKSYKGYIRVDQKDIPAAGDYTGKITFTIALGDKQGGTDLPGVNDGGEMFG